jgi:hypothetical protein
MMTGPMGSSLTPPRPEDYGRLWDVQEASPIQVSAHSRETLSLRVHHEAPSKSRLQDEILDREMPEAHPAPGDGRGYPPPLSCRWTGRGPSLFGLTFF